MRDFSKGVLRRAGVSQSNKVVQVRIVCRPDDFQPDQFVMMRTGRGRDRGLGAASRMDIRLVSRLRVIDSRA